MVGHVLASKRARQRVLLLDRDNSSLEVKRRSGAGAQRRCRAQVMTRDEAPPLTGRGSSAPAPREDCTPLASPRLARFK